MEIKIDLKLSEGVNDYLESLDNEAAGVDFQVTASGEKLVIPDEVIEPKNWQPDTKQAFNKFYKGFSLFLYERGLASVNPLTYDPKKAAEEQAQVQQQIEEIKQQAQQAQQAGDQSKLQELASRYQSLQSKLQPGGSGDLKIEDHFQEMYAKLHNISLTMNQSPTEVASTTVQDAHDDGVKGLPFDIMVTVLGQNVYKPESSNMLSGWKPATGDGLRADDFKLSFFDASTGKEVMRPKDGFKQNIAMRLRLPPGDPILWTSQQKSELVRFRYFYADVLTRNGFISQIGTQPWDQFGDAKTGPGELLKILERLIEVSGADAASEQARSWTPVGNLVTEKFSWSANPNAKVDEKQEIDYSVQVEQSGPLLRVTVGIKNQDPLGTDGSGMGAYSSLISKSEVVVYLRPDPSKPGQYVVDSDRRISYIKQDSTYAGPFQYLWDAASKGGFSGASSYIEHAPYVFAPILFQGDTIHNPDIKQNEQAVYNAVIAKAGIKLSGDESIKAALLNVDVLNLKDAWDDDQYWSTTLPPPPPPPPPAPEPQQAPQGAQEHE